MPVKHKYTPGKIFLKTPLRERWGFDILCPRSPERESD